MRQRPADSLTEFVRLTSSARVSNNLRDADIFPKKIIDLRQRTPLATSLRRLHAIFWTLGSSYLLCNGRNIGVADKEANVAKRKRKTHPEVRRPKNRPVGQRTYPTHGQHILTHSIDALPILNRLLQRMRLEEFLTQSQPPKNKRTKINTPRVVLLILRNLLVSRERMYVVVE